MHKTLHATVFKPIAKYLISVQFLWHCIAYIVLKCR